MRRTHSPPQSDPESAERPRKRLRNDTRPSSTSCRQLLLEEVDLEIALQERLAATVQSRITWALLLQQAVEKDVSGSGVHSFGFRDAALDALAAVEAPCEVLFTREAQPNPSLRPSVPSTPSALIPVEGLQTRTRGLHRTARPPPRKLLFLRNTSKFPPQIVKLACPDCSRTDFSSLQGILNHCHLGHNREFGSHDDCVQSCAVLVEDPEEQAWVVSNGTEVAGVSLPGLRRLFELAVGGGMGLLPTAVAVQPKEEKRITPEPTAPLQEGLNSLAQPTEEQITTVTRTLGVHSDSPALAPFLGRAPTKRRIKVYNEEEIVDICGAASATTPRATWRKQYAHRNNARAGLDEVTVSSLPDHPAAAAETVHVPSPTQPLRASSSRFHIAARVSIRDISQSIPQSRRVSEHTHRWRLAVTSPSYSLPISSFLKKLTVTCLTDPPPSSMTEPIVVEKAPFFITGTTDRPFLARLTFTWASEDKNPQKDVDHWVEVDPIHLSNPVLGDEQVFDVEIDRRTDLLSTDTDPDSDAFDFGGTRSDLHNGQDDSENKGTGKSSTTQGPDYARKLRSLLPLVPMTLKDVKGKLPRQPPYTLVSTPAQYRGLLYGRRKALEWARARALLQAYDDLCSSSAPTNGKPHVTLTAVDVLHWLEDEGHFPRFKV
ncbi:hypothetical protein NM688_g5616 [Phlebia brevispora]|uniref:Uncharacterized protein n=1 Tax=Phlebia brevispora TaxID=194682 RepID=A0ACC1SSQ8_9APHY|nr:hypothetical protein NM688_g5616 [Phlebia brevispora]